MNEEFDIDYWIVALMDQVPSSIDGLRELTSSLAVMTLGFSQLCHLKKPKRHFGYWIRN